MNLEESVKKPRDQFTYKVNVHYQIAVFPNVY